MNMIEKVARALFKRFQDIINNADDDDFLRDWEYQNAEGKEPYLADAKAAITAMMNPTKRMLTILTTAGFHSAEGRYNALIETALEEDDGRHITGPAS